MKTSARNHLTGVVLNMDKGPVNDEVTVMLDCNGMHMIAEVDAAVVNRLGIETGTKVTVLIKTHDVIIVTDSDDVILSARNQLPGTIVSIKDGGVSADVRVRLEGGGLLSSVVTMESIKELDLEPTRPVKIMVKASNLILAVQKPK